MHEILVDALIVGVDLLIGLCVDDDGMKRMLAKLKADLIQNQSALDSNGDLDLNLHQYIDKLEKLHDGNREALSLLKRLRVLESAKNDYIAANKASQDDLRNALAAALHGLPDRFYYDKAKDVA